MKIHLTLLGLALSACTMPSPEQYCAANQARSYAALHDSEYSIEMGNSLDTMTGNRVAVLALNMKKPTALTDRSRVWDASKSVCGIPVLVRGPQA